MAASSLRWRAMTAEDLDGVVAVAAIGFPDHFEGRDCFKNRLEVFPQGCFALADDACVRGYLVAYPWIMDSAPALNSRIDGVPGEPSVLYLHDLALHPDTRRGGWSRPAVQAVVDLAKAGGFGTVALVAVNDAVRFWEGHGFRERMTPAMTAKLKTYGNDARYMTRDL